MKLVPRKAPETAGLLLLCGEARGAHLVPLLLPFFNSAPMTPRKRRLEQLWRFPGRSTLTQTTAARERGAGGSQPNPWPCITKLPSRTDLDLFASWLADEDSPLGQFPMTTGTSTRTARRL